MPSCSSFIRPGPVRTANFGVSFTIRDLPNGGHKQERYYEMTKDGFSFLVMGYTGAKAGEFKERFINEFNKREMMLKDDDYILMRSQQILQKRLEASEEKIKKLEVEKQAIIEETKPAVVFTECVKNSPTNILVRDLAKLITQNGFKIGECRLYDWLVEKKYLIRFSPELLKTCFIIL